MAAPPDTPPHTPDPGKGNGDGNVDYRAADIKNSIATGHIHGYEVILATINVTVDSANNLTKDIQEFMAKVDLQLQLVSFKVGATASVLGSINALVVKQAKKKGLTVDKEVKEPKKIENEETNRGNVTGTPEETKRKQDAANEILSMTAFQAIMERTEGAHKAFDDIRDKIKEALKAISLLQKLHQDGQEAVAGISVRGPGPDAQGAQRHPGTPKTKVGLSNKDRRTVLLTEEDLVWMEKKVEIHWKDLYYRFIIFEYSLEHERQDKGEEDIESIKQELESVKLIGKNMWKEIKRLAEYLCGNDEPPRPRDEPPSPRDEFRGPRPRPPPEALRRYLPEPSRVNSLYVGWEFRKPPPPPPPPPPYGRSHFPMQKSSWDFVVPQRMPFSTEEMFLRVLAQAAQRAKSDRTLRDDYWGVLKKTSQRTLVDALVQEQNDQLHGDFPQLEWTIAGLETKTDPWALIASHGRSRAREKKARNTITAFEVILKTQWRITHGYGPPDPIPGNIWGPTPGGPSGLGLGLGPLPGGGRGGPPDGYRPYFPPSPVGGPPFPSGGGAGGHGVPIIIQADAGISGGPQHMPQIHAHSRPRPPREPTQPKHRPVMVLRQPTWVLVKQGGKKKEKGEDKKNKSRRKDAGDDRNRQQTSKRRVYVELREPGRYSRTAAAGPSEGGHRPSLPPGPGIPHRLPFAPPLRPPPPPRPAGGFVPAGGGHWGSHIPPMPLGPRPPPPHPPHIYMSSAQTQRELEKEEEEAEEVVEEIFEEFSELTDTKGKNKSNRRHQSEWEMQAPAQQVVGDSAASMTDERRRMERERRQRQDARTSMSISRSLMRQVEEASSRRLVAEGEELQDRSVRLERMAERRAPPPPSAFVVPRPVERTRLARERGPRVVHVVEPPRRSYMDVEREREAREPRREPNRRVVLEHQPRYSERQPPPPPPIRSHPTPRRAYVQDLEEDEYWEDRVSYREAGSDRGDAGEEGDEYVSEEELWIRRE